MRTRHLVDTAVFDFDFSDEETAFEVQSELESVIKQQLLQVVDEVFAQKSRSGFVMRIPTLEVDLGSVSCQDYREELPQRLRERLSALLSDLQLPNTVGPTSQTGIIEDFHAEYLQLEHFLKYGSLPWYGNPEDDIDWSGILLRVLRDHAQRLKNFLEVTPHRRQVTGRLVNQFELTSILRMFGLLAPSYAEAVGQLMEQLTQAWRDQPLIINTLGLEQDAAERQLWFFLLEIVLGHDGHQYSAQELLVKALQRMLLEKHQLSRKVLTSFIEESKRRHATKPSPVSELLQQLMQQQQAATDTRRGVGQRQPSEKQVSSALDAAQSDHETSEWLRALLAKAIQSGDIQTIDALWEDLMPQQTALFRQLLQHYGQDARLRKRLAQGFSETRLCALLETIEPLEHEFVTGVIDRHELFLPSQDQTGGERTRRQLWEFTLGYLLVERGSRFNKKTYLASLLRQMARSVNLHFGALLDNLLQNLDGQLGNRVLNRQMRQLLMELRDEQGITTAATGKVDARVETPYLLYERLTRALMHGVRHVQGGEAALVDSIDELRQTHPWLLLRLARELRAAPGNPFAHLSSDLPPALLSRLVLALLELMSPDGSDLRSAVKSYAERADDKGRYFRRVLISLVEGELLDFEALIGETDRPGAAPAAPRERTGPAPVVESESPSSRSDQDAGLLAQRIDHYLQGEVEFSDRAKAELTRDIERQLQSLSQPLLDRLSLAAEMPKRMQRLIGLLPERLLAGIVYALAGQATRQLLQLAELMMLACQTASPQGKDRSLIRIKWSAVFSYLGKTGGLFNEQAFISHTLEHLTEQWLQGETSQLRSQLVQGLIETMLPSTREVCSRVIEGLKRPLDKASSVTHETAGSRAAGKRSDVEEPVPQEEVYINNAGLVLAAPYLPRLFEMLELVEKSAFKSAEAALRAVHLLQYLVDECTAGPEYRLFLNKLLCGVKTDEALPREIEPDVRERQILNGLLQGMIDNWKALGNTSVAGLREAFLQRQGRLRRLDDAWHLQVEAKAYDMLLDQLPWSFAIIKHPWMERVIHVEWR